METEKKAELRELLTSNMPDNFIDDEGLIDRIIDFLRPDDCLGYQERLLSFADSCVGLLKKNEKTIH